MLRIEVRAADHLSSQARTYAEYRVFAALLPLTREGDVRGAQVELRDAAYGAECVITIVRDRAPMIVRASASHVYGAINRAVERLDDLVHESLTANSREA